MKEKLPANLVESTCSSEDMHEVMELLPEAPGAHANLWYTGANPMLGKGNPNVVVDLSDPFKAKSTMSKGKKPLI